MASSDPRGEDQLGVFKMKVGQDRQEGPGHEEYYRIAARVVSRSMES